MLAAIGAGAAPAAEVFTSVRGVENLYELEAELPPEGQKLFVLMERLFGDKKGGGGAAPGPPASPADLAAEAVEDLVESLEDLEWALLCPV